MTTEKKDESANPMDQVSKSGKDSSSGKKTLVRDLMELIGYDLFSRIAPLIFDPEGYEVVKKKPKRYKEPSNKGHVTCNQCGEGVAFEAIEAHKRQHTKGTFWDYQNSTIENAKKKKLGLPKDVQPVAAFLAGKRKLEEPQLPADEEAKEETQAADSQESHPEHSHRHRGKARILHRIIDDEAEEEGHEGK
jgi:hypothetical protein